VAHWKTLHLDTPVPGVLEVLDAVVCEHQVKIERAVLELDEVLAALECDRAPPCLHQSDRLQSVLDQVQLSSFEPLVGQSLTLCPNSASTDALEVVLVQATALAHGEGRPRTPFSLVFRGPLRPVLPQQIYRLEHAELGALDIFLVPIGPDAQGMRYEAVFT
jgi:hypothetical protein